MKKMFTSIGVAACVLATVILGTGCSTQSGGILANPAKGHVVQVSGKAIIGGVVIDPVTGQNTLGYKSGYITVTTIPIVTTIGSNGVVVMSVPDVATAFEVQGKNTIFGAAGSSYRLATGVNGMNTLLANAPPINEGFYGTNNQLVYQQPATISSPIPVYTTQIGTNLLQAPILLKP